MNRNIAALEVALSRHIDSDDIEDFISSGKMDALAEKFVNKRNAVQAMRAYLESFRSSPRILGLLVYSTKGQHLVRSWVSQGMDVELLYHALLNDGMLWHRAHAPFGLEIDVISGDARWDFNLKALVGGAEHMVEIPGTLEAMVERMRRTNRIDEVLRLLSTNMLTRLLVDRPTILANEVRRAGFIPESLDMKTAPHALTELFRIHLDPMVAVSKIIGKRVA